MGPWGPRTRGLSAERRQLALRRMLRVVSGSGVVSGFEVEGRSAGWPVESVLEGLDVSGRSERGSGCRGTR